MRVMLVDDAPLIRTAVGRLLRDEGFDVVSEREDARDLVGAVARHRPDVVVLDVRMPPTFTTEGLTAAVAVRAAHPDVGILVLSQQAEVGQAVDLLRSGRGVGYLLKERVGSPGELAAGLRRVAGGGTVVDPAVVARTLESARAAARVATLTEREREVLVLVSQGLTNTAVAQRLRVNLRTVETHVGRLLPKLGLLADPGQDRRVLAVLTYLEGSAPPASRRHA